jgi:hypothetical protein
MQIPPPDSEVYEELRPPIISRRDATLFTPNSPLSGSTQSEAEDARREAE